MRPGAVHQTLSGKTYTYFRLHILLHIQTNHWAIAAHKLLPPQSAPQVCTIGPATSSREALFRLADAGMNVARLNMSHGSHESHKKVVDLVKVRPRTIQTNSNACCISNVSNITLRISWL